MPLTAEWAGQLLRASFAGEALPAHTATVVSLCTSETTPTETSPGTPIEGDPRVGPGETAWTAAETTNGVTTIANSEAFSFTDMPEVASPGVRYYDVWDTSDPPIRKAYGRLAADRVTVDGDTLTVAASALSQGMVVAVGNTTSIT